MLTFGYSEICPGKCEWRNEETRIYSALVVNISRAERWSDSTVLKQMSADLLCTLWLDHQLSMWWEKQVLIHYWMAYDLCNSELDRAGIILTTGLCGLRGYVFPKDEKIGVFGKKSQKNKKCLSVWKKFKNTIVWYAYAITVTHGCSLVTLKFDKTCKSAWIKKTYHLSF